MDEHDAVKQASPSWRLRVMLAVLVLVNILNYVDRQLPFILAEAIKRDLELSDTQLGLLSGLAFALCYSLAALPLARLADLWSAKKVLAGAVVFWSMMTAAGGFASGFIQLALTRTGVALGEAGSAPASHAIIARTFLRGARGKALALFSMGAPIGVMLGLAAGGWLADVADWRTAMIIAGVTGAGVALLVIIFVPDAQPGSAEQIDRTTLGASLKHLFGSRAFTWMFIAMCLIGLAGYPFLAFGAPYFIRIHGLSATQAGLYLGLIQGVLGAAGTILGGVMFDRAVVGQRHRVFFWPAIAFFIASPMALAAWFASSPVLALLLLVPMGLAVTFYAPALYGGAHMIAGPRNEATATSLLIIGPGLVGASFGPLAVGMISDALAPRFGIDALRWALIFVPAIGLVAGAALMIANGKMAAALHDH